MPILKNLNMRQRLALALLFGAFVYALLHAGAAHADTLAMFPAHGLSRVSDFVEPNPAWFGLIVCIAAILFIA